MIAIARKLAESKYLNKKLRKSIYIHGVNCACQSGTNESNSISGDNCFCEVDVDLLGSRKLIKTNIDQPTDIVKISIDPVGFTGLADQNPLFTNDENKK